jgi:hypothetical protein
MISGWTTLGIVSQEVLLNFSDSNTNNEQELSLGGSTGSGTTFQNKLSIMSELIVNAKIL